MPVQHPAAAVVHFLRDLIPGKKAEISLFQNQTVALIVDLINRRTDFDLQNIARESGKSMEYRDKVTNEVFVPHVIEPSIGVERLVLAVLSTAYVEDEINGEKRIVLKLPENLAPFRFCVSPLLKNKPELVEKAKEVYDMLRKKYINVTWDDSGNIGKRYRKQDEIGTPKCIVIDFDTLEDGTVTVRDRDTTEQTRVAIEDL